MTTSTEEQNLAIARIFMGIARSTVSHWFNETRDPSARPSRKCRVALTKGAVGSLFQLRLVNSPARAETA